MEESFEDPARLAKIEDGRIILDVGFDKYDRRVYSIGTSGELSIEVIALRDFRAAYSLLTLFRKSVVRDGPPGDACTISPGSVRFSQERYWVRISGNSVSDDFLKRVALSVSNRMLPRRQKPPSIIAHFPKAGVDASNLQYFPGLKAFESYAGSAAANFFHLNTDAEIAQAQYTVNNQPGVMFLLNFPTGQVAEDYFDTFGNGQFPADAGNRTYAKRAGPIVAILKGAMDAASADKLLGDLHYSYSIRWIYEKRNKPTILWGIPVKILGTVVRSLFFIAILGVFSIIAGAGFAILRFVFRGRFSKNTPGQPEQAEITRLRLQ